LTIEFTRTQKSNYLHRSKVIYLVHSPRIRRSAITRSRNDISKDTQHCYNQLYFRKLPRRYWLLSLVVIYPIYSVVKNR